jgi:serine/threonine protein kinase
MGFSFGSLVYEMLTRRPVFLGGVPPAEVVRRLRSDDLPALPAKFGDLMVNLLRRCWANDPKARPSFNDILNEFIHHKFAILPEADPSEIRASVEEILAREREAKGVKP